MYGVILAGGSGTRLWPLSRADQPKQFLKLNGDGTMLQETAKRLNNLKLQHLMVVCNKDHRFLVADQLEDISKPQQIILEPFSKNTAPAVALAAFECLEADPLMLVLSADHVIEDETAFSEVISISVPLAEAGKLVIFGTQPTSPSTEYGYIKKGKIADNGFMVDKFTEKPSFTIAKDYLSSGDYLWNSGIFLFRASRYLEELEKYRPQIFHACKESHQNGTKNTVFHKVKEEYFLECPSESLDYAVLENTSEAVVVPMNVGWNDVGTWSSLWGIGKKDKDGNVSFGNSLIHDSQNCYINASNRLVAIVGIKDLIIVDTKDALMVADMKSSNKANAIVQQLKQSSRSEWKSHREVHRPWGKYDSVDNDEGFQVKRITVKPREKLSVQMHKHRSEHWVVVNGVAKVTIDKESFFLNKNESTFIPAGTIHSLENPSELKLEIIEVQVGSYLGEDDIIRFEDIYGRTDHLDN